MQRLSLQLKSKKEQVEQLTDQLKRSKNAAQFKIQKLEKAVLKKEIHTKHLTEIKDSLNNDKAKFAEIQLREETELRDLRQSTQNQILQVEFDYRQLKTRIEMMEQRSRELDEQQASADVLEQQIKDETSRLERRQVERQTERGLCLADLDPLQQMKE